MTDMTEEIHLMIKKSLPQHVGEVLTKELSDYAVLKRSYSVLDAQYQKLDQANTRLTAEVSLLKDELNKHASISKREELVRDRELQQHLRDVEVKFSELRRQDAFELVKMVFKSPTFRTTQTKQETSVIPPSPPTQYNTSGTAAYPHQAENKCITDTGEA